MTSGDVGSRQLRELLYPSEPPDEILRFEQFEEDDMRLVCRKQERQYRKNRDQYIPRPQFKQLRSAPSML